MKTLTATVVTVTMAMTAGQTMAAAAAAPAAAVAAPAPAPVNITHGPAITGLCTLSAGYVQTNSLYGKAIGKQLDVISNQINTELNNLKNSISTDAAALDKNKATMTELQYNQNMLTLQDKANTLQTLAQQRQQEMDLTEQQQNNVFAMELQTIAIKVYQEQKCTVLFDRDASVMIFNPAMDLSDAVTKAMDKDKTTVAPFTRASVAAQPAPTGAAAR